MESLTYVLLVGLYPISVSSNVRLQLPAWHEITPVTRKKNDNTQKSCLTVSQECIFAVYVKLWLL